jgi:hypothetical protein
MIDLASEFKECYLYAHEPQTGRFRGTLRRKAISLPAEAVRLKEALWKEVKWRDTCFSC